PSTFWSAACGETVRAGYAWSTTMMMALPGVAPQRRSCASLSRSVTVLPTTLALDGVMAFGSYSTRHPSEPRNAESAWSGGPIGGLWQTNPWGHARLPGGAVSP